MKAKDATIAQLESKVDAYKRLSDVRHNYVLGVLVKQGDEIRTVEDRTRALEEAEKVKERERAERRAKEAANLSSLLEIMQMANKKDQK